MAGYDVIANVSESIVSLLRERIRQRGDVFTVDPSAVALVSPGEVTDESDVRLGLYLYNVTENPTMKNTDRSRLDETRYQDAPLALDLQYLLTAYPGDSEGEETARSHTQQRLLGLAMQVLHDNARLGPEEFPDDISEDVQPQVSIESEPIDVMTGLWSSFDGASFAPSVTYHVGPVLIDSIQEADIPEVHERETQTGRKPDPRQQDGP